MRSRERAPGAEGRPARTGISLGTVVLLAAFLVLACLPAALASPAWSDPHEVSTPSDYHHEEPQLAVDAAGAAHIVWSEYIDYWYGGSIWYATNAGGAWSAQELVSTQSEYEQYYPRLALDPDGNAHVVWEGYDADGSESLIWYATNAGGTWSDPVNLSPDDDYPYYSNIAVDSAGIAHVAFHAHNSTYGGGCSVVYTTNAGGTWSYPVLLSGDHGHSGSYPPVIAVDPFDHPHVVSDGDDEDIWYTANLGSGWSEPLSLSTQSSYDQGAPRMAVDSSSSVHVVWEGYDADGYDWLIWYADNAGGAWSTPENISPDDSSPYSPNIAVDSVGAAHVVFHGHNETHGGDCSVVYATNAGGDWSYPVLLSGDHGHNGSWLPWIAVDPFDHPHVVSDGDDEDIWYTANLGSGWSEPLSLSTQSTYEQGAPQIAVDINGNPHAAWHGYGSVDDYYQIWYSADISQCIVRAAVEGGHGMVDPEMQAVPVGGTATIALIPDEGYRVGSVTDNGA
ncbi:MAG: hypothetical protein PHS26_09230, partial [Actinomycetota bacterium]|nr:hypothetical protein [Actinomycetota bacterium]